MLWVPRGCSSLSRRAALVTRGEFSIRFRLSCHAREGLPRSSFPPSILSPCKCPTYSRPFQPVGVLGTHTTARRTSVFLPAGGGYFPTSTNERCTSCCKGRMPPGTSTSSASFSIRSIRWAPSRGRWPAIFLLAHSVGFIKRAPLFTARCLPSPGNPGPPLLSPRRESSEPPFPALSGLPSRLPGLSASRYL